MKASRLIGVPQRGHGADVMPPRASSAVVGVGLGLVGVLATRSTAYAPTLTTHARRAAGLALLARALTPTGLLLKGLGLPEPAPELVRLNRIAYRPLCLALAPGLLSEGPRAFRGRGWQRGQEKDERFMNASRLIGVPHRGHGRPSCPYAANERSK